MEPRGVSWFKSMSVSASFPVSVSLSNYLSLPPFPEVTQLNFCSLEPKEVPALPTPIPNTWSIMFPMLKIYLGSWKFPVNILSILKEERR